MSNLGRVDLRLNFLNNKETGRRMREEEKEREGFTAKGNQYERERGRKREEERDVMLKIF